MVRLTAENRRWWILTTMTGALAMVLSTRRWSARAGAPVHNTPNRATVS
jgi:hypothetical protein